MLSKKNTETFRYFQVFDFDLQPKSKTWNYWKRSFTSNFDNSFNLRCKNDKKLTKTKT